MSFSNYDGIRYFQFETLNTRHAVFTRHGGVSPEPWGSLNVGGTVGDDLDRVRKNRQLSFRAMGRSPESAFEVWQVHSADVVCARAPRPQGESLRQADVILTDQPNVSLFMRTSPIVFRSSRTIRAPASSALRTQAGWEPCATWSARWSAR
ncbi:MAG: laccase domain-containing protein [Anaerolineales bacterium]